MDIRTAQPQPARLGVTLRAISLLNGKGRLQDCSQMEAEVQKLHQAPIVPCISDQKELETVWKEQIDLQRQLLNILVDQKRDSRMSEKIRARVAVIFRAGRMTSDVLERLLHLLWKEVFDALRGATPSEKIVAFEKAV